jgi:LmbE family N-acetylglucosaminyl deacetylase
MNFTIVPVNTFILLLKNSFIKLILTVCFISLCVLAFAQPAKPLDAAEIQRALLKLNTVGAVLYVAAHPDDENTALLSYMASERNMRTGYLSLTRGDGGQNLIGTEQAELMGVIRTQELLAARRIDGAEQFFTRANDFGFSKGPDETFNMWNKEAVLADVVWTIRKFRPDIIITRFPTTGEGGHGHHTASAILANEAFTAAADPKRFAEQLKWVKPWKARRIYWNTWTPDGKTNVVSQNLGTYNPLMGRSHMEVSAQSRSMHKSQGFGAAPLRGDRVDYLALTGGDPAVQDALGGIDVSWSRVKGGERVSALINQAIQYFKPQNPAAIVPVLADAYRELQKLDDPYWKEVKSLELKNLIAACSGLWYEALADDYTTTPGGNLMVKAQLIVRNPVAVQVKRIRFPDADTSVQLSAVVNTLHSFNHTTSVPAQTAFTHPYWIRQKPANGLYQVSDQHLIGLPEAPAPLTVEFDVEVSGLPLRYEVPLVFKRTDPVEGEVYRKLEVVPQATITLTEKVYVFPDAQPKNVMATVRAGSDKTTGTARLDVPKGWRVEPASIPFTLGLKGEEVFLQFRVYPPKQAGNAVIEPKIVLPGGKELNNSFTLIQYAHIPVQTLFPKAEARLVRVDLAARGRIGYIMGAGDDVPAALRQVGYHVDVFNEKDLDTVNLGQYQVMIAGVRAYNTVNSLKYHQKRIMDYVHQGGTYIVQYTVSSGIVTPPGPLPFKISRDRITIEEAPLRILHPQHSLFTYPSVIGPKDFEGWVQERGLYFADQWDDQFLPMLAGNDPGESEKKGMLLYAKWGKGNFVYTGLSFFRQLPAGVPGAYRLFNNMMHLSNEVKPN